MQLGEAAAALGWKSGVGGHPRKGNVLCVSMWSHDSHMHYF